MALPHLNSDELNKLRRLVDEGVKVEQEVKDLKDGLRDTIKSISEELEIPAKILTKAIRLKFKGDLGEIKENLSDAEDIVEISNNPKISSI